MAEGDDPRDSLYGTRLVIQIFPGQEVRALEVMASFMAQFPDRSDFLIRRSGDPVGPEYANGPFSITRYLPLGHPLNPFPADGSMPRHHEIPDASKLSLANLRAQFGADFDRGD